jgi:hypothetical protein
VKPRPPVLGKQRSKSLAWRWLAGSPPRLVGR